MPTSLVYWTVAAIVLFWALGAYNRLMRLRAEANAAFSTLESELARQIDLVREQLPAPDETQPAPLDGGGSLWAGLHGAAAQCAAALAAARGKPLEGEGIAALSAARDVLARAWERAERDDAHDLAGPKLPEALTVLRAQLAMQAQAAAAQFNASVERYNAAITQFPAMLLASLFGFRPGRCMGVATAPIAR